MAAHLMQAAPVAARSSIRLPQASQRPSPRPLARRETRKAKARSLLQRQAGGLRLPPGAEQLVADLHLVAVADLGDGRAAHKRMQASQKAQASRLQQRSLLPRYPRLAWTMVLLSCPLSISQRVEVISRPLPQLMNRPQRPAMLSRKPKATPCTGQRWTMMYTMAVAEHRPPVLRPVTQARTCIMTMTREAMLMPDTTLVALRNRGRKTPVEMDIEIILKHPALRTSRIETARRDTPVLNETLASADAIMT